MADFTPEEFEEEKYVDYFPQLQTAYKRTFNTMNEEYSSDLVHAIDQQILNESEPHYEGDGEFTIELPENPLERLTDVVADEERVQELLDIYVEELKSEHRRVFGFEGE
ncbi:DUF5783 family protein [Halocalculus aciditolerans]|uniref:Uncharacterized protein n=1 Tax=Halocalculus aciditolerans TaxID=1383812 RepID=A0A830F7I8_9EURY|nr:DUF5783 family protein [Halocalculus aciditolerans]GGL47405.1 hypothetical protein GCM10009039_02110 [Halocalculus aciditolerans]